MKNSLYWPQPQKKPKRKITMSQPAGRGRVGPASRSSLAVRWAAILMGLVALVALITGCAAGNIAANESAPEPPEEVADVAPATVAPAKEPVRIENEGQLPFYARISEDDVFHDDDWAVIVFYRPPSCIPGHFNLLDLFHLPSASNEGAFACSPPTTNGVETWANDPQTDPAPLQAEIEGNGATPVWFVSWPELEEAIADNKLTIDDLQSMPSLKIGSAMTYQEFIRPGEMLNYTAEGELEDGRLFSVNVHDDTRDPKTNSVQITITDRADEGYVFVEDNDGQVPFYARIGRDDVPHNDDWAVITFYRSPDCVPEEFNLLDFFHFPGENGPGAFGCAPTTRGTELWEGDPAEQPAPKRATLDGRGAVPIWLVSWPEVEEAVKDDVLTRKELEAMPSLVVGLADSFHEVLHPGETNELHMIRFTAEGTLEGGEPFAVSVHDETADPSKNQVIVEFGE